MKVVVIGAGIIGASIAYNLARRGGVIRILVKRVAYDRQPSVVGFQKHDDIRIAALKKRGHVGMSSVGRVDVPEHTAKTDALAIPARRRDIHG